MFTSIYFVWIQQLLQKTVYLLVWVFQLFLFQIKFFRQMQKPVIPVEILGGVLKPAQLPPFGLHCQKIRSLLNFLTKITIDMSQKRFLSSFNIVLKLGRLIQFQLIEAINQLFYDFIMSLPYFCKNVCTNLLFPQVGCLFLTLNQYPILITTSRSTAFEQNTAVEQCQAQKEKMEYQQAKQQQTNRTSEVSYASCLYAHCRYSHYYPHSLLIWHVCSFPCQMKLYKYNVITFEVEIQIQHKEKKCPLILVRCCCIQHATLDLTDVLYAHIPVIFMAPRVFAKYTNKFLRAYISCCYV
eukprot:TRINITY_DN1875_c0_g1_i1.p1 TRINITY_DN1875_c0_g1~~TRINITY_DN1875_c0_g1_i1.p1  ORF type:complete len:297 (-),score=-16.62 TRINITY_DN1875_c0_g1_i1:450-1340(-)